MWHRATKYEDKNNYCLNKNYVEFLNFKELLKKKIAIKWGKVQTIVNQLVDFFFI